MRILFDHNVPRGLRTLLPAHDIATTNEQGWSELTNGQLLAAAETAGFQVMVTCDQSLSHQQNLTGLELSILVLTTNLWPVIQGNADLVAEALKDLTIGSLVTLRLQYPRRG